jgi:hypothetical protein
MNRKPSTSNSISKSTLKISPEHVKKANKSLADYIMDLPDANSLYSEEIALQDKRRKVVAGLQAKYPNRVIYEMSNEILNSLDENDSVWPFED